LRILYDAEIVETGADVPMIVEENVLIFFDHKAPKELHDVAVVHKDGSLEEDVRAGDKLVIGDSEHRIIFVGDTANDSIRSLGHFTVNFTGDTTEALPGSIYVEAGSAPETGTGAALRFIRE